MKPKLSLKTRIIGLMATGVLGITALYSWKTSVAFQKEHESTGREMASRIALTLSESSLSTFKKSQENLKSFVQWHELQPADPRLSQQFFANSNQLLSVAVIRRSTDGTWKMKWLERSPGERTRGWPNQIESTLVKKVIKDFDGEGYFLSPVANPSQQGALYTLTFSLASDRDLSGEDLIVGFYSKEWIEELARPFKGALAQIAFADKFGKIIAQSHAEKEIAESTISPLITALKEHSDTENTTTIKAENGSTYFSSLQPIPKTNVYTVVSIPISNLQSAANYLPFVLLVFGVGFLALMSTGVIRLLQGRSDYVADMILQLKEILAGRTDVELSVEETFEEHKIARSVNQLVSRFREQSQNQRPPAINPEVSIQHEDKVATAAQLTMLQRLSEDLARDLKNPLAAVMGNVLLAKGKTLEEDVRKHLESIEKEARFAKDQVERILRFHNLKTVDMVPVGLTHLVQMAIEEAQSKLEVLGVTLHRDFYPIPQVKGHIGLLAQCLPQAMLQFARILLKHGHKDMVIRLEPVGNEVRLILGELSAKWGREGAVLSSMSDLLKEENGFAFLMAVLETHKGSVAYRSAENGDLTLWIEFPQADGAPIETAEAAEALESELQSESPRVILEPDRATLTRTDIDGSIYPDSNRFAIPDLPEEFLEQSPFPKLPDLDDLKGFEVDKMDFYPSNVSLHTTPPPAQSEKEEERVEVRVRRPRLRI